MISGAHWIETSRPLGIFDGCRVFILGSGTIFSPGRTGSGESNTHDLNLHPLPLLPRFKASFFYRIGVRPDDVSPISQPTCRLSTHRSPGTYKYIIYASTTGVAVTLRLCVPVV